MVECARDFMILVDIITFLLGCAILGVAIYVVISYSYFQVLVSINTVYISMGVGAALMLVACLGCVARQRGHKGLLCLYLFIVTGALAAQIASVVLVSEYAGVIKDQGILVSGGITTSVDKELNNAILSTYVSCCLGCSAIAQTNCNNQQEYFNNSIGFCSVSGVTVCSAVPTCSGTDPNQEGCFISPGTLIPPVSPDKGICTTFQTLNFNGSIPIVGPQVSGSCGGGSPQAYIKSFVTYFNTVFYWFIVGFGILCGIQALNLLAAIYLLSCTNDHTK